MGKPINMMTELPGAETTSGPPVWSYCAKCSHQWPGLLPCQKCGSFLGATLTGERGSRNAIQDKKALA